MIFQEPMASLNPVVTVGRQISEAFIRHEGMSRRDAWERTVDVLRLVRMPEPERRANEYPHQLSGGMNQRVMIGMALACGPKVLLADEPTTALDVTIQAQIFDLMLELKEKLGTAIVLITHDMGIIAENARRVVVMYAGRKVEEAAVEELFSTPCHPDTSGLLGSIPRLDSAAGDTRERLREVVGIVPSPLDVSPGCAFAPRCSFSDDECRHARPELERKRPGTLRGVLAHRPHAGGGRVSAHPDAGEPVLLEVEGLRKYFPVRAGIVTRTVGQVHAVDGVSFSIAGGETLGLVGESGCGKSTAGKAVLKLVEPTAGIIRLRGHDITRLNKADMRPLRREMQLIFQDPFSSLNPRMTAGAIVREPLWVHGIGTASERDDRVAEAFSRVGLRPEQASNFPRPVLRRTTPAHRNRARTGARTEPHRVRRVRIGPRRVDSGPGHQPAHGPAGGVSPGVPVHRARSHRGGAHQPPRGGDVHAGASSRSPIVAACSPLRCTLTPKRSCPRSRFPIPVPRGASG